MSMSRSKIQEKRSNDLSLTSIMKKIVQRMKRRVAAVIMMTRRFTIRDIVMVTNIINRSLWKKFMINIPRQHVLDKRPTPSLHHN
jgi:hypothetical protein